MAKGELGWIQRKTRTSPTTGRVTVTHVARITPPNAKEYSKSFARKGRVDEPGTAAHWLNQEIEKIRRKQWVDPRDRKWTVGEWHQEWIESLTGVDEETIKFYQRVLDLDVIPSGLADDPLDVDWRHLAKWMNKLEERPWSKVKLKRSTINTRRIVMSMMFGAAHEEGLIPRNPMRKVKNPGGTLEVEPIDPNELPTPDKVWQLHDIATKVAPLIAEQIIVTAGTGVRPGELLGLQRKNTVNREAQVVRQRKMKSAAVEFGLPKTRKMRRVAFGDEVDQAFARHIDLADYDINDDDVIFRFTAGKDWHRSTWASHWNRVRVAAGLPNLKFYLLRHYYASVLINGGASPKLVMERMGHSSSKYTLERYARLWHDNEEVTRALSDAGLCRDNAGTIRPAE